MSVGLGSGTGGRVGGAGDVWRVCCGLTPTSKDFRPETGILQALIPGSEKEV